MLERKDLGGHHLLNVLGRKLPFPAGVVDGRGHFLRVKELAYVRHPTLPALSVLRGIFEGNNLFLKEPVVFQAMVNLYDPNLAGLEEGARILVSAYRAMATTALADYAALLHPCAAPKWLRRARNHARRTR